eukprot:gene23003-29802_t
MTGGVIFSSFILLLTFLSYVSSFKTPSARASLKQCGLKRFGSTVLASTKSDPADLNRKAKELFRQYSLEALKTKFPSSTIIPYKDAEQFTWDYLVPGQAEDGIKRQTFNSLNKVYRYDTNTNSITGEGSDTITYYFKEKLYPAIGFSFSSSDAVLLDGQQKDLAFIFDGVVSKYETLFQDSLKGKSPRDKAITIFSAIKKTYVPPDSKSTGITVAGIRQLSAADIQSRWPNDDSTFWNFIIQYQSYLNAASKYSLVSVDSTAGQVLSYLKGSIDASSTLPVFLIDDTTKTTNELNFPLDREYRQKIYNDFKAAATSTNSVFDFNYVFEKQSDNTIKTTIQGGASYSSSSFFGIFSWGASASLSDQKSLETFDSERIEMKVSYKVFTSFPVQYDTFNAGKLNGPTYSDIGWYASSLITEAKKNAGQDVTGYKFDNSFDTSSLAVNGPVGLISNFFLSDEPTIKIKIFTKDVSKTSETIEKQFSGGFKLFGIGVSGGASEYKQSSSTVSDDKSVTITLGPKDGEAFATGKGVVLGVSAFWPGTY